MHTEFNLPGQQGSRSKWDGIRHDTHLTDPEIAKSWRQNAPIILGALVRLFKEVMNDESLFSYELKYRAIIESDEFKRAMICDVFLTDFPPAPITFIDCNSVVHVGANVPIDGWVFYNCVVYNNEK